MPATSFDKCERKKRRERNREIGLDRERDIYIKRKSIHLAPSIPFPYRRSGFGGIFGAVFFALPLVVSFGKLSPIKTSDSSTLNTANARTIYAVINFDLIYFYFYLFYLFVYLSFTLNEM
jgi:hypothetical protein